jgi:hypothetical protein
LELWAGLYLGFMATLVTWLSMVKVRLRRLVSSMTREYKSERISSSLTSGQGVAFHGSACDGFSSETYPGLRLPVYQIQHEMFEASLSHRW